METIQHTGTSERYAQRIEASKPIRWHSDRNVIHGSKSEVSKKLLPDRLSKIERLPFLDAGEKRLLSQIQGRTYANIFGLVERLLAAKVLELSHSQGPGDQIARDPLVSLYKELEHQEMFRHIERMAAAGMAEGYAFLPEPNAVAALVHGRSVWAVLGLVCHIELFVLAHYRESIDRDQNLSVLCKDVFLYHWSEQSKHAVLAELEWLHEDARLTAEQRDRAVDELIELVTAIDGILQSQSQLDADYFLCIRGAALDRDEVARIRAGVLDAYRSQYLVSGAQGRFAEVLNRLITPVQRERIGNAFALILS